MITECANNMPGITLFILCNSQKSPMRSTIMLIIQQRFKDEWHQSKASPNETT